MALGQSLCANVDLAQTLVKGRLAIGHVDILGRVPAEYDAIVVGGGHNGLATAAYLGRAGLTTLVLERRTVLGGAAVSEHPWPGYTVSTLSYVLSLMPPEVGRGRQAVVATTDDDRVVFSRHPAEYIDEAFGQPSLDNRSPWVHICAQAPPKGQTR